MTNLPRRRGRESSPHPATAPVYSRALRYGAVVTLGIAVAGSLIGYLIVGPPGVYSALMGAGLAMIFMGLTAASLLVATKVTKDAPPPDVRFFAIVMGTWFVKLIVFIAFAIWLRGQSWLDPTVFSIASLTAVVALLVVDVIALQTSRVPYVEVTLPGEGPNPAEKPAPNS
ncbi:MAG: hypothetical protein ABI238_00085 [Terrimesophilobacter sp.]